ncbi:uncharacterized protein BDZ99DRAFT_476115 [Mytilinidion resinicola]|uniref:Uncharacterized protein n=1 Tax=Mytilinidion resinicola TaxID=574789 RepID=A0A6A6YM49_9PEZI|nr:uncharacterized protein BDZ99DRAFT_476115 [Mytilinidion resinicola]KAF2809870.1 hypothetical protein BDZ99DRAFT_476115 [Mytilinidion resinicola]
MPDIHMLHSATSFAARHKLDSRQGVVFKSSFRSGKGLILDNFYLATTTIHVYSTSQPSSIRNLAFLLIQFPNMDSPKISSSKPPSRSNEHIPNEPLSAPTLLAHLNEIESLETKITDLDAQAQTLFRQLIIKPQTPSTTEELEGIELVHTVYLARLHKLAKDKTELLSVSHPGLADSFPTTPPPPPTASRRAQQLSDWPHLISQPDGHYTELRCPHCHGNGHETADDGGFEFLRGVPAFSNHLAQVHGVRMPNVAVFRVCAGRELIPAEVDALVRGGSTVRPVVEWPCERGGGGEVEARRGAGQPGADVDAEEDVEMRDVGEGGREVVGRARERGLGAAGFSGYRLRWRKG